MSGCAADFLVSSLCPGEVEESSNANNYSMDKAKKLGWFGFVDSSESLLEVFDDLAKLKMIPPVPKVEVKFN